MADLREFDVVRVVRLAVPDRPFDGTEGVMRAPQVGDVGTICHEIDRDDPFGPVIVEMVDDLGRTVWLADFAKDELELVTRH